MDNNQNRNNMNQNNMNDKNMRKNRIIMIVVALIAAFVFTSVTSYLYESMTTKEISYDSFVSLLNQNYVETVVFDGDRNPDLLDDEFGRSEFD